MPFICFDLAGGANMAGSNVLVGGQGGQFDFLTTAGYSKLGLPGDMIPAVVSAITPAGPRRPDAGPRVPQRQRLPARHAHAACRGGTAANVNGAVIPARSENDTGNNPHNPMYGIARRRRRLTARR